MDTSNNLSASVAITPIKIDTQSPVIIGTPTTSGAATAQTVEFKFQDSLSGIATIKYLKGLSATTVSSLFDGNCDATGANAVTVSGSPSLAQQTVTITAFDAATQKIAYCVKDAAGNTLKGTYPSTLVGCFSASNLSPVPTLANYAASLTTRITASTYGYGLTESADNASCFRGIIAANVATYVTNQYTASTATTLNWSEASYLRGSTTNRNTNGYYYHT